MMSINCQHWSLRATHGTCALGKFGGHPSIGVCRACLAGLQDSRPSIDPAMLDKLPPPNDIAKKPCANCRGL